MKDLTNDEKLLLLAKIKSFLNVTWDDPDTNSEIWDMIVTSINFIDETSGFELDYLVTPEMESDEPLFNKLCYKGQDLLKNRVFYEREKGLDDFRKNYLKDINDLYIYGRILKGRENAD